MHLTLIRHGESSSNVTGRWQGQGDSPLSPRGLEQARALAVRLDSVAFDRVVCSDLRRAADTAAALGRGARPDPAWRELDLGRWEGLTPEEVDARWPEESAALKRGEDVPVGGAERWSDLERRVRGALERLRAEAEGERVLVVAHGGVIITLVSSLKGVSADRPRRLGRLGNTSITQLSFEARGPVLWRYNDTLHAPDAATDGHERSRGRAVEEIVAGDADPARGLPWGVASPDRAIGPGLGPLEAHHIGLVVRGPTAAALQAWNVGPRAPR